MTEIDIIRDVLVWHKIAFPNASFEMQKEKIQEEVREYHSATTCQERYRELADIAIVAIGCMRWDVMFGLNALNTVYDIAIKNCVNINDFIIEKMKVNKSRVWQETKDGYYHHKEVDK